MVWATVCTATLPIGHARNRSIVWMNVLLRASQLMPGVATPRERELREAMAQQPFWVPPSRGSRAVVVREPGSRVLLESFDWETHAEVTVNEDDTFTLSSSVRGNPHGDFVTNEPRALLVQLAMSHASKDLRRCLWDRPPLMQMTERTEPHASGYPLRIVTLSWGEANVAEFQMSGALGYALTFAWLYSGTDEEIRESLESASGAPLMIQGHLREYCGPPSGPAMFELAAWESWVQERESSTRA